MKMKPRFPSPVDLLFPTRCIICRRLVAREVQICPECARALKPTGAQAAQHGDFFDVCYAPFFYAEPLRTSFLRYKFNGLAHYAKTYGRWMADCMIQQEEDGFDCITWAPLHWRRKWRRGYDQAELLAREVGAHLDIPVLPTLKKAYRPPLSKLKGDKAIRAARILGAYSLRQDADVTDKRILLVDDIVTSGATFSECARILKTAGAETVVCIALARRGGKN